MFAKLREKLKNSLSIFSRKAKEEVAESKRETAAEKIETVEKKEVKEVKAEPKEVVKEETHVEVKAAPVIEAPKIADSKVTSKLEQKSEKKKIKESKTTPSEKSAKSVQAPQHPPGMICDDEKGICIPAEMAAPKTKQKTPVQEKEKKKTEVKPKVEVKEIKPEIKIQPEPITIQEPVETKESETDSPKKGFFSKAKEFFTTKSLSEKQFDELFWSMERALLESNVAFDVVSKIKEDLKAKLINKPLPRDLETVVENSLKESIESVLNFNTIDFMNQNAKKPLIIAFFGINGSGKTTTIAKVAHLFQQHNKTCVMAAGDTFRAAAIQQLEEHAANLNVKIIKHNYGADSAAVAFDAVKYAQKQNIDVVLIDTAGRLHSDSNLMDELKKIVKVSKPDIKIFVGESITGNDCIEQAQKFDELIGIDGLILTKADVDEKGGTALSISYVTKKPILYIGTGQNYSDLKPFTKELVMDNLGLN